VLAQPAGTRTTAARAKARTGGGGIAWWQIDHPAARRYYGEALDIERELGKPSRLAEALSNQSFAVGSAGELEEATKYLLESVELFRASSNEHGVARGLTTLVMGEAQAGNWDGAIKKLEESVTIWRRLGDRLQLAFALIWLGFACGRARRWGKARSSALEAMEIFGDSGNPTGIALAFRDLAFIANWEGHHEDPLRLAGAAEALREQLGGGPPPGFGGMLQEDPTAEARQQLPEDVAQRCWDEGFHMDVKDAVAFARSHFGA